MVEWGTEDLVRRVERVLDTAGAAIDLLEEAPQELDLEGLEAPPDKVAAETAMLLRAVVGIPAEHGLGASVTALASRLNAHARGARTLLGIALHPALARDYAAAHLALSAAGWPAPEVDEVLARSLNSTAGERERLPHRELEQAHLARMGGGTAVTEGDLLGRTALATGVDLLTGSRDDIYALTHAVFYATDFGRETVRLPRPADQILAELTSALAGALDDDDFDLAGELLVAWPALSLEWNAVSTFAFHVLARVEDEVGRLPSLSINGRDYHSKATGLRNHYVTATTYHPAYVMGLLCSVCLQRSHHPPSDIRGAPYPDELVDGVLAEIEADDRSPQWLVDFRRLSRPDQLRLGGLLTDVAIRRAVRQLDLQGVRRLLATLVAQRSPMTALGIQAARLLGRLAQVPIEGCGGGRMN
jgi:hypothetical protein